jgi:F-type H+-transporting ATPase subunit gamma
MAEQPKELRKRIRSVASTQKITRTMELVATSKMKRAQDRVNGAVPYIAKIRELVGAVSAAATQVNEPLLAVRSPVKRVQIFLITANRGLCGGYNANNIRLVKHHLAELKAAGVETLLDVVGKKGFGTLKYQGYPMQRVHTDLTDKPTYEDAQKYVAPLVEDFLGGKVDRVDVVYTHWKSLATQKPMVLQLLPVERPAPGSGANAEYIFSPSPEALLSQILPLYLAQTMYTCLVEANACEQVARRTAMKSATDNAVEMNRGLTRKLNRARQAAITQEIAEVVGGADALKK